MTTTTVTSTTKKSFPIDAIADPKKGRKFRSKEQQQQQLSTKDEESKGIADDVPNNSQNPASSGSTHINVNFNVSTTNTYTVLQSDQPHPPEVPTNPEDKNEDSKKDKSGIKKNKKKKKETDQKAKEEPVVLKRILEKPKSKDISQLLANDLFPPPAENIGGTTQTNTEIEKLEKEVANAKKEVKGLEDKLLELKIRNQEFETHTFVEV